MGFEDRIGRPPLEFLSGCFVWIPVAILVISIVNWAVQTDIDVFSAIFGLTLTIGLGIVAQNPPERMGYLSPLILFILVASTIVVPVVRFIFSKRELDMIEVESIEGAYRVLVFKPGDLGARMRIARSLWARGVQGPAIALAEMTLENVPEGTMVEEFRTLNSWYREFDADKIDLPLTCLTCGYDNPPYHLHCPKCGSQILLEYAKGKVFNPYFMRRLIASWIAGLGVVVGVPVTALYLPPVVALPLIFFLVIASGTILFRNFSRRARANAPS